MLGFIKRCFFTGLAFLSTLTTVNSLNCISMNNQECKERLQIVNVNSEKPVIFPFSILKQVNAVTVVTLSIVHMQNCVFLILLKV